MLNSVAFIGYGTVGLSCHKAFEHNTRAIVIDPKHSNTEISDLISDMPNLIFVSVSAPTVDGKVDATAIYEIFRQLADIKYPGIVVLKSTVTPDIANDLYVKFGTSEMCRHTGPLRYVYSPEFIREKHWEVDSLNPQFILLAGDYEDCVDIETIYRNHSQIKHTRFTKVDFTTASLIKYSINSFLAMKVTFMNEMKSLYFDAHMENTARDNRLGVMTNDSWHHFLDVLSSDTRIGRSHMEVPGPDGLHGYGGTCFPKDIKALIGYDQHNRLSLLREVEVSNTKIRIANGGDK